MAATTGVPVLRTERLVLDGLSVDDAPFLVELLTDPAFLHNIGDRGVRTEADVPRYLEQGPIASYRQHGFGLLRVSVCDLQSGDSDPRESESPDSEPRRGEPIGICGLLQRPTLDDADIGFAFLPRFWGRGYALEAARRVVRHAFEDLGLPRVVAITRPDNDGSIRVLERLGMRCEGTLPSTDTESELRLYGLDAP